MQFLTLCSNTLLNAGAAGIFRLPTPQGEFQLVPHPVRKLCGGKLQRVGRGRLLPLLVRLMTVRYRPGCFFLGCGCGFFVKRR